MSRAAQTADSHLPERAVRNCSQYAETLHRNSDTDEPEPACWEQDREDAEFREVDLARLRPFYDLCQNPECFGGACDGR